LGIALEKIVQKKEMTLSKSETPMSRNRALEEIQWFPFEASVDSSMSTIWKGHLRIVKIKVPHVKVFYADAWVKIV